MIKVRVPASSANMGSGFDSLGIALKLYNYVSAEEIPAGLEISVLGEGERRIPTDGKNLVYRSMRELFLKVGYTPTGLRLILENNIPTTRGLGSSSASIIGGLFAANIMSGEKLTVHEMLDMAAKIEGHADNVAPALLGGFTVSVIRNGKVFTDVHQIGEDLRFAAFIPDFALSTKRARSVLPRFVPHRDAVFNTGRSALLTSSLISGNYDNIRTALSDRLHQNYRKRLIPHMDELFRLCTRHGALGAYLSGAGPTVMAPVLTSNKSFQPDVSHILNKKLNSVKLSMLEVDNIGAVQIK